MKIKNRQYGIKNVMKGALALCIVIISQIIGTILTLRCMLHLLQHYKLGPLWTRILQKCLELSSSSQFHQRKQQKD